MINNLLNEFENEKFAKEGKEDFQALIESYNSDDILYLFERKSKMDNDIFNSFFNEDTKQDLEVDSTLSKDSAFRDDYHATLTPDITDNDLTQLQDEKAYNDNYHKDETHDFQPDSLLDKEVPYHDNCHTFVNVDPFSSEDSMDFISEEDERFYFISEADDEDQDDEDDKEDKDEDKKDKDDEDEDKKDDEDDDEDKKEDKDDDLKDECGLAEGQPTEDADGSIRARMYFEDTDEDKKDKDDDDEDDKEDKDEDKKDKDDDDEDDKEDKDEDKKDKDDDDEDDKEDKDDECDEECKKKAAMYFEDTKQDLEVDSTLSKDSAFRDDYHATLTPDITDNDLTQLQDEKAYNDNYHKDETHDFQPDSLLDKEVPYHDNCHTFVNVDPFSSEDSMDFLMESDDEDLVEDGPDTDMADLKNTDSVTKSKEEEVPGGSDSDMSKVSDDTKIPDLTAKYFME